MGASFFKALSFPIFSLGYLDTTASTSFVPKPGMPVRRIVAVVIPLARRNWRLVVKQFIKHPFSFLLASSIKFTSLFEMITQILKDDYTD